MAHGGAGQTGKPSPWSDPTPAAQQWAEREVSPSCSGFCGRAVHRSVQGDCSQLLPLFSQYCCDGKGALLS
jgi:hypothetical protein